MMKAILILVALFWQAESYSRLEVETKWKDFQVTFKKTYRSPVEARKRFQIFEDNLRKIGEHNARFDNGEVSYSKNINQFGDMTSEEFLQYVNKYELPMHKEGSSEIFKPNPALTLPETVDWRKKGCLTAIKDQKLCGACWAFSATATLEAQIFLKTGNLTALSAQNLLDCSSDYGNAGCDGGSMRQGWDYVKDYGLESEADYPFTSEGGKEGPCKYDEQKNIVSISGYKRITTNETDLQAAIAEIGPISVVISVSDELQFYYGGVLIDNECYSKKPNHQVVAVGYGSRFGKDYYRIRNSWGTVWGEKGYLRLGNRGLNPCGILSNVAYPLVN